MTIGKRKVKIELEDAEGGKYNLSLEGNISKDKIVKIFEFMDLLNIEGNTTPHTTETGEFPVSVGSRIWRLVETKLPYSNFTSSDLLELYEDEYNEPIKLSIISTYLSRYSARGRLERSRHGKEWVYRYRAGSRAAPETSASHLRQMPMQMQPDAQLSPGEWPSSLTATDLPQ